MEPEYEFYEDDTGFCNKCYKSALEGNAESQCELALLVMAGEINGPNIPPDWIGFKYNYWLRLAADQGLAVAQCQLGINYLRGDRIEQNFDESVKWLLKAAEQDCDVAQHVLGECYEKGQGVPQDKQKAIKWYIKAAENGYMTAIEKLEEQGIPQTMMKKL